MSAVRALLRDGGHDPSRYHQESFDIAAGVGPEPTVASSEATSKTFAIKLSRSSKTFTMSAYETVLRAAKKVGVAIVSSCSQGMCRTCKTKVAAGRAACRFTSP
jgi:ferredoxin